MIILYESIATIRNGFAINSKMQPNNTGSPISRFFLRDVRAPHLPNSINRNLDGRYLMENRRKAHLKRVERKESLKLTGKEYYLEN